MKVLTERHFQSLKERGWTDSFRIMPAAEMKPYREKLEAFERAHPADAGKLEQNPHLLFRWLDGLVRHPRFLDAAEDLVGPNILCPGTGFRRKDPGRGTYAGWHQDAAYLHYDPQFNVAIVAVTDSTVENGCVHLIPGSHRGPILAHEDTDDRKNFLTRSQRIEDQIDVSGAVPMELEAGEAFIIDERVIHGSPPNNGRDRRILFLIDLIPTHAKRKGSRDAATLLRGRDDHGHCTLLPVPEDDFGPDAKRLHRLATETRNRDMFQGTDRVANALST
jgi:hypothetical protein